MPMPKEELIELIKKKIPDADFDIKDLKGDDLIIRFRSMKLIFGENNTIITLSAAPPPKFE